MIITLVQMEAYEVDKINFMIRLITNLISKMKVRMPARAQRSEMVSPMLLKYVHIRKEGVYVCDEGVNVRRATSHVSAV